jgi:hypothetical protein
VEFCFIGRAYCARLRGQEDRPRRLGCLIGATAHSALNDEFAHAQGQKLRRLVPAVSALDVGDLEGRLVGRPEGECNDSIAFPEILATDLAFCGPFPERNLFYL